MKNIVFKATINKGVENVAKTAVKEVGKVATKVVSVGALTNPATLTAAVAVSGIYATYKYLDNKDKRRYESRTY